MAIYSSDHFALPLPDWHRFPMAKYERLRERVERSGIVSPGLVLEPPAATDDQIRLAHDADYLRRVVSGTLGVEEARALGFPWSPQLVERSRRSAGATVAAARDVLGGEPFGVNLAGGTHHAAPDRCAGYCVFNDAAIAARAMQREGRASRVLVVDCDVHHGDGTALIFAEDPTVFTFSIHGERNYPLRKPPGDLDLPLPDGTGDDAYLDALSRGLAEAVDRSRADLAFYLAGADPFESDRLGRMAMTKAGLEARDRLVFEALDLAGIPVAVSMAGGYSADIDDIVDIHFATVRLAVDRQSRRAPAGVSG
ncbi:histone deacetylase family protein [Tautonia plasticadhaerens]|uniref:Acetoin utilization protein AcuC n=1 Tax=Tautonia plasticadhaerens TaxID=2527974 RepID=A0A518H377_9BACT|nr:histone deacetylase [Tautonia plasticadhaerens]QDV35299.1 Acetoin utilization protein AcuC [Tautonia plasticadhaerens]